MDVNGDDPNLANHAPAETQAETRPQQVARFRSNYRRNSFS